MSVRKLTKSRNAKSFLAITLLAASALVVLGGGIFIQSTHAVSANTEVTLTFAGGSPATTTATVTGCGSDTSVISVNGLNQWFYASGSPNADCTLTLVQPASSTERYVFGTHGTISNDTLVSGTTGNTYTVYDQFQVNIGYTIPNSPKGSPGTLTDYVRYTYLGTYPTYATPPLAPAAPVTKWVDYDSAIQYDSPIVNFPEGWQIQGCFGWCTEYTATSAGSVSPDYYHGFAVEVYYTTNDGSYLPGVSTCGPVGAPDLSYYSFGQVNTGFVCPEDGEPVFIWMDAGSTWTVLENVFPASPTLERWDANMMGLTGTVSGSSIIDPEYFNQYTVTASYKTVDGGVGSSAPKLALSSVFGAPQSYKLTTTATTYWSDDVACDDTCPATWTVPLTLGGSSSTQRWENPATLTGPVSGALTLTPGNSYNTYYHQYKLSLSYFTSDGSPIYGSPSIYFDGYIFGVWGASPLTLTTTPQTAWFDANEYEVSTGPFSGALATEQWSLCASCSGYGTVTAPGSWTNFEFWHQFEVKFSYTVVGGAGTSVAPGVMYQSFGSSTGPVTADGVTLYWADANVLGSPSYPGTLSGSLTPTTERWQLNPATVPEVTAAGTITPTYTHQYKVTIVSNGPGKIAGASSHTGWYNNGAVIPIIGAPKAHHLFVDWTSNSAGLVITNPAVASTTVTIGGSGTITAWFR